MEKLNKVIIDNIQYTIIDSMENITLADSFVQNKIGKGNGEAKLYIGNQNNELNSFFGQFEYDCFFLKKDFEVYLEEAKEEFIYPTQNYSNTEKLEQNYYEMCKTLNILKEDVLKFKLIDAKVTPPRVYVRDSTKQAFNIIRKLGLPNLSHISILKIMDDKSNYYLYFCIFFDGQRNIDDKIEYTEEIKSSSKESIIKIRIGQSKYRRKLIEDCGSKCPFTFVTEKKLLIASHIKPWSKSTEEEKVDIKNGFIFTPTYDKLFDQGYITFSDNKELIISPWLSIENQKRLGLQNGKIIEELPLDDARKKYLNHHRKNEFKGFFLLFPMSN